MNSWIDSLLDITAQGDDVCLVTVTNVRGSAPREAGARMIVTPDRTIGTIGGGQLEYQCTRLAVERLRQREGRAARNLQRTFPLGTNCGQCCGGIVDVLFENVASSDRDWLAELRRLRDFGQDFVIATGTRGGRALIGQCDEAGFDCAELPLVARRARELFDSSDDVVWDELHDESYFFECISAGDFNIVVFGAGHVGSAVVATLAPLQCRIRWVDGRRNVFPKNLPQNVATLLSPQPASEVQAQPPDSYFLVMTHSHALDYDICDRVLRRQDARYCGLIGSLSKRKRFERLMRKQGMPADWLQQLTCPIGVTGVTGKRPPEIAIAVAAELLQIRSATAVESGSGLAENVHVI